MSDGFERSLLFGILAARDHLVDRKALLEAMGAWVDDPSRGLEQDRKSVV